MFEAFIYCLFNSNLRNLALIFHRMKLPNDILQSKHKGIEMWLSPEQAGIE